MCANYGAFFAAALTTCLLPPANPRMSHPPDQPCGHRSIFVSGPFVALFAEHISSSMRVITKYTEGKLAAFQGIQWQDISPSFYVEHEAGYGGGRIIILLPAILDSASSKPQAEVLSGQYLRGDRWNRRGRGSSYTHYVHERDTNSHSGLASSHIIKTYTMCVAIYYLYCLSSGEK